MEPQTQQDTPPNKENTPPQAEIRKQPCIAFMVNPNPVFFNDLDYRIIDELKKQGADVVLITFEDIYLKFTDKIQIYHKQVPLEIDGFLCYGHMSPEKKEYLDELIRILDGMGVICLYNQQQIDILSSKLHQAVCYAKHKVPIPKTITAFSVKSTKDYFSSDFNDKAIVKECKDYGGEGIKLSKHPDEGITFVAKFQWMRTQSLTQELIPDVWGKSIRVLIINGEPYACAKYNDNSGDFRSNVSFHKDFSLQSLMDHPKLYQYYEIAKKAADSISPELNIVGVDIVDSETKGLKILEVNMWPDMYDIEFATKLPIFEKFATSFFKKVQKRYLESLQNENLVQNN